MDIEVKSFWDNCHITNKVDSLSGCQYDETIDFLKIRDYIKDNVTVLEIGVGLGYVTKGLKLVGANVSCVDVSTVGLDRVKDYCEFTYLVSNLDALPTEYFDVIICNNVVQHVETNMLREELKQVLRSLKIGGVFAVEFVSTNDIDDTGINPTLSAIQNGGLCRSPECLEQMINNLGGKCALVFSKEVDFGIVQGHHVFHVTK